MIIAVDFDGILFEDGYPGVGKPIWPMINLVKRLQEKGHRLILWSCRGGEPLLTAIKACEEVGIHFVSVNAPDPEHYWDGPISNKVYADLYIDDRAINPLLNIDLDSIL